MPSGGRRTGAGRKPGAQPETIAKRHAAQRHRTLTAERTIEEIARLSLSDIGLLFDEHGTLKPLHKLPPAIRACIASVKVTKYNKPGQKDGVQEDVIEVKLWDKVRALDMAARHHGLLVEKLEVFGQVTLADKIARARARLAKAKGKP